MIARVGARFGARLPQQRDSRARFFQRAVCLVFMHAISINLQLSYHWPLFRYLTPLVHHTNSRSSRGRRLQQAYILTPMTLSYFPITVFTNQSTAQMVQTIKKLH